MSNKKKIIIAAIVAVALVLVIAVAIWAGITQPWKSLATKDPAETSNIVTGDGKLNMDKMSTKTMPKQAAKACDAEITRQGSQAIVDGDLATLKAVSARIEAIPQYENDPSCVYILSQYQMMTGQAADATVTLNRLDGLLSAARTTGDYPDGGYNDGFVVAPTPVSELRGTADVLAEREKARAEFNEIRGIEDAAGDQVEGGQ